MTTPLDDILVPAALNIIDTYGQNATFHITGVDEGDYDPETRTTTFPAQVNTTRKISPPEPYDKKFVDGSTIQSEDLQTYVAGSGLTFTPVNGMQVTVQTVIYNIKSVQTLMSGTQIAAYLLQIRK